jgi:hypothetical protein
MAELALQRGGLRLRLEELRAHLGQVHAFADRYHVAVDLRARLSELALEPRLRWAAVPSFAAWRAATRRTMTTRRSGERSFASISSSTALSRRSIAILMPEV